MRDHMIKYDCVYLNVQSFAKIRDTFNEYKSHNEHSSSWFVAKRIYGFYMQKIINKASLRVSEIMYWKEKKIFFVHLFIWENKFLEYKT